MFITEKIWKEEAWEADVEKSIDTGIQKRDAAFLELINQGYTLEQLQTRLQSTGEERVERQV